MLRKWKISMKVGEEALAGGVETIDDIKSILSELAGVSGVEVEEVFEDEGCGA